MLLLIDGNNLAHRARHVFSLSNKGVDVSVIYGFLKVTMSLILKYAPTSVMVCFDGGIPNFRRQAVPSYKANRHKDEDPAIWEDFNRQLNELSDYTLPMMGVVVVRKAGVEADDLLYHASRLYVGSSLIVTNDKDLLQAVSPNVSVLNPSKDIVYNVENFEELVGIPVTEYIYWRALQGDSSDNIPGVPGIGEKTATKLFKSYGSISNIVNAALGHHLDCKMENKLAENICSFGLDSIYKNVLITTLHVDRVGAKRAILDAVGNHILADKLRMKKYLMRNGFVSFLDGKFYKCFLHLERPMIITSVGVKMPVVISKRVAFT